MTNTDYSSNYDEIFEIDSPEPNSQTANNRAIGKLNIYFGNKSSDKTDYENDKVF